MGGKKGGENTKKVAGNARKAEAAAAKQAEADARKSKVEDEEWGKGAKTSSKKCVSVAADPAIRRQASTRSDDADHPLETTIGMQPRRRRPRRRARKPNGRLSSQRKSER